MCSWEVDFADARLPAGIDRLPDFHGLAGNRRFEAVWRRFVSISVADGSLDFLSSEGVVVKYFPFHQKTFTSHKDRGISACATIQSELLTAFLWAGRLPEDDHWWRAHLQKWVENYKRGGKADGSCAAVAVKSAAQNVVGGNAADRRTGG